MYDSAAVFFKLISDYMMVIKFTPAIASYKVVEEVRL